MEKGLSHNKFYHWLPDERGRVLTAPENGLISNTFSVELWIAC